MAKTKVMGSNKSIKRNKGDEPVAWDDKVRGDRYGPNQAWKTRGEDIVTGTPAPNTTSRRKSGLTTKPAKTTMKKDESRLKPGAEVINPKMSKR